MIPGVRRWERGRERKGEREKERERRGREKKRERDRQTDRQRERERERKKERERERENGNDNDNLFITRRVTIIRNYNDIKFKGIYNPQYLPNDFFALSTFLDDLKPSHLNLSIQICP